MVKYIVVKNGEIIKSNNGEGLLWEGYFSRATFEGSIVKFIINYLKQINKSTILALYQDDGNINNETISNLKISDKNENNNNNTLLYGKIVNFNMTVEDIIEKINDIEDCKFKNNIEKYTLKTIMAYTINGEVYKVNIIY